MRLGIQNKIIAGYVLVIIIMALIATGVFISTNRQMFEYTRIAHQYHQAEGATMRLFLAIRKEETAVRTFLINNDQRFIDDFSNAQQQIVQERKMVLDLMAGDHEIYRCLQYRIMPVVDYLDNLLEETLMDTDPESKLIWKQAPGLTKDFIEAEEQLFSLLNQRHTAAMFRQREYLQKSYITKMVLILLLALFSIALGITIARSITGPLLKLRQGIKVIKGGDYQQIEGSGGNDELGELNAFNQMVTIIEENEADLRSRNEELLAQEEELSAQNEEILAQQRELEEALGKLIEQEQLLNRLFQFTQLLTRTIELDHLAQIVLTGLLKEGRAENGVFMLYEQTTGKLHSAAQAGYMENTEPLIIGKEEGLVGIALRERRPVAVNYRIEKAKLQVLPGEEKNTSELFLPLFFDDEAMGLVVLGRTNGIEFSPDEQKYLMALSGQTAVAVRNALYHRAVKEDLKKMHEVDELKTELINTVSHELRTPLTSILGFSELLLNKNLMMEKMEKYVGMIHQETVRLSKLVNNFLDLQRIETGRIEFQRRPINLDAEINSVVEAFQGQSKRHTITFRTETDLPMIETDPEQVRRVLENLLSNAVKYSPAGGEVEVIVKRSPNRMLAVMVKDNGLGIPQLEQEKIFQPFYRVDKSDRREIGGTGLGLAIAFRTVRALGGELRVESKYGVGSTFTFTLPY